MTRKPGLSTWFSLGFAILCWLFGGILEVQRENETSHEFFIKDLPSVQIVFNNPYDSVPMGEESDYSKFRDADGNWLPGTKESSDFSRYCKYRYGITDIEDIGAISRCRSFEGK